MVPPAPVQTLDVELPQRQACRRAPDDMLTRDHVLPLHRSRIAELEPPTAQASLADAAHTALNGAVVPYDTTVHLGSAKHAPFDSE